MTYPEGRDSDRAEGQKFAVHFWQGAQIRQMLDETLAFEPSDHLAVRLEVGQWIVFV